MAQRVITSTVCDWDDEHEGETAATEQVTFGVDGVGYESDGCEAHAAKARAMLDDLKAHARRISNRRAGDEARPGTRSISAPPRKRAVVDRIQSQHMRAWVRERHPDVSDRGRIPQRYADEYHAAHPAG